MSTTGTLAPAWTVAVAGALLLLALATAAARASVLARRDGRTALAGAADPLREAARLLRQRGRRTVAADLLLWRIASSALLPVALGMAALVPIGGRSFVPDGLGVVWFNTFDVSLWAFFWLLGWGGNASFALTGAYRFLALALAYELPLMFSLVAPAIAAGSLDPTAVAADQGLWYVVWMPVGFVGYCVGVLGFTLWGPLRAPAGLDIGTGVLAELSGVDRLLVQAGRYALLVAGAAFAVPLFLGGTHGPWLPDAVWLVAKTAAVVALLVVAGERLPVMRPDKVLEAGWTLLLPAVVLQDLVVAVAAVTRTS